MGEKPKSGGACLTRRWHHLPALFVLPRLLHQQDKWNQPEPTGTNRQSLQTVAGIWNKPWNNFRWDMEQAWNNFLFQRNSLCVKGLGAAGTKGTRIFA
jgi:hypothetical protein